MEYDNYSVLRIIYVLLYLLAIIQTIYVFVKLRGMKIKKLQLLFIILYFLIYVACIT